MSNPLQLKFLAFSGYFLLSAFLVARLWMDISAFLSVQLFDEMGSRHLITSGELAGSSSEQGSAQDDIHVPQRHNRYQQINHRLTS